MLVVNMKIALVTQAIPNNKSQGGPYAMWSLMKGLQTHGIDVAAIALPAKYPNYRKNWDIYKKDCLEAGFEVFEIENASKLYTHTPLLRRLIAPRLSDVFPHSLYAMEVSQIIYKIKPDFLVAYHFEGLAALSSIPNLRIPYIGLVGDPTHLALWYNFVGRLFQLNRTYVRRATAAILAQLQHPPFTTKMLNSATACGDFGAYDTDLYRKAGANGCEYYQSPLEDPLGPKWRERRDSFPKGEKPKIMLIGLLTGTATIDGLYFMMRDVLPVIEEKLGRNNFEIHIIGRGYDDLPNNLKRLLDRPSIRIRGFVESIENEFLSSDALFVPTKIKLGLRMRILTGFSYGIPVVAHVANCVQIPEMIHEQNSLVGESGEDLANALIRIIQDKTLKRRLENASRELFEKFFYAPVAVKKILNTFSRLKV